MLFLPSLTQLQAKESAPAPSIASAAAAASVAREDERASPQATQANEDRADFSAEREARQPASVGVHDAEVEEVRRTHGRLLLSLRFRCLFRPP